MNNLKLNTTQVSGTSAQYDGFSAGDFGTSVNLFKGEAAFDYPLVTGLPNRNGVGIHISASYSSSTDRASRTDNLSEPTGVLGLGWQFGYPAIIRADTGQILPPERETFYYIGTGGLSRLYQTRREWQIAKLDGKFRSELSKSTVSLELSMGFYSQGVAVTMGSEITTTETCIVIVDDTEECEFSLTMDNDKSYAVFYDGIMFEASNYDFSKIVYFPRFEKWLITQKDGIRKVFGGINNNSALQYIVHYNGLVIPSSNTDGQVRAVLQWNLSKELSVWDDEVCYSYLQDTHSVGNGGLEFTRACYLSEITDACGYHVVLSYGEKTYNLDTKEYIDPQFPYADKPIAEACSYQYRYETRYLSRIDIFNPDRKMIDRIEFGFDIMQLSGYSAIQGAMAKRLLTSVTRKLSSGGEIPPEQFSYITGQASNLGALESIITATGTVIRYDYTQKQLTHCSARSLTVPKDNFTDKKMWNAKDYSAVLLYNESTSLFRIYNWVGRFQTWTPPKQPFVNIWDTADAIITDSAVILYSCSETDNTTKVVCYRENPDVLGAWTVEVSELFSSARCSITADGDWFIVNERDNGRISLFTYDLLHRKTNKTVQTLDTTHAYVVASNGNSYALLDYDIEGMPGEKSNSLCLFALDGFGNWSMTASVVIPEVTAVFDPDKKQVALSIAFNGGLCVIASVYQTDVTAFYYDLIVCKICDGFENIYLKSFTANVGKSIWDTPPISWQPEIAGQLIISGGVVLAFDGKDVLENISLSTADFNFNQGTVLQAAGNNCVLQSRVIDSERKEVLAQALIYDPNNAVSFPSAIPYWVHYEQPGELNETGYAPSICGRIAVFGDMIFDLYTSSPFERPIITLVDCRSSSIVNGGNFAAYSDNSDVSRYIRFVNGMPLPDNTIEGTLPDVPTGISVFTAEDAQNILIYVNTGDSFNEAVSNYQVARIIADDGFAKTGKAYVYEDDSAVCDSSGRYAKYYTVDVYSQCNEGNGFTRYSYCNSLADVLPSDNSFVPYATDGQLRNTIVFDSENNELSRTTFQYNITRSIAEMPCAERTYTIYGAVTASSVSTSMMGGVTATVNTEYDAYSGETSSVKTSSCNVFGDNITTKQSSYPAAAEHPLLAYQNRIAELGRSMIEWQKNDETSQIVEQRSLLFDSAPGKKRSIIFSKKTLLWNGDEWKVSSLVNAVDINGNIIEQEVPEGILQSQIYSSDGLLPIGSVTNASVTAGQTMICTFEAYEDIPSEWKGFITREKSFAGTSSLKISKSSSVTPITRRLPCGEYAVSCWSIGSVKISINGDNVDVTETNFPKGNGKNYNLARFTVHDRSDVKFGFANTSGFDVYVDIFSISPFGNPPMINVYKDFIPDAGISSYREFKLNIRDRRNNTIGVINEKSAPSMTIPFYKRLSRFHGIGSLYNAEMIMKFTHSSNYEPVCASNQTLTLQEANGDYGTSAVYVDVSGSDGPSVALGGATVSYSGGNWTLSAGSTTEKAIGNTADGEWLLLVGKKVMFFFNGEYVFGINAAVTEKPLTLKLSGNVAYSKLLYGSGISFGIRYLDTAGRIRQGQMYDGDKITVTQNFYDEENRLIAQTKPVLLRDIPFGFINDFAMLDRTTGLMTGRVADAYPEDEGFPYVSQAFEHTPLGRQNESGLPGKEYAINPNVPIEKRQTTRLSYDHISIPGLSLSNGKYNYMVTTSPEGKRSVSIINSQRQQVAVAALGTTSSVVSASATEYADVTKIEREYLPAFFDGDNTAVREKRYDYRGNLVSKSDPNCIGKTVYCYNKLDEQRFMQTPELARTGRFVYQKYDELHRIIEEGLCFDTWEQAQSTPDDPSYPERNIVKLRIYKYGDDIGDIGSLTTLVNVSAFNEDGLTCSEERYTYDNAGRRKSKSVKVPGVDRSFTESLEYDNDSNIISTTNVAGKRLIYDYDCVGRMRSEYFDDGTSVAKFFYLPNDTIESVITDGGTTKYGYTSAGWIKSIRSPLLEETIDYSGTRIDEFTVSLNTTSPSVPSSVRYLVKYDDFGRLASALCYNGDTLLEDISIKSITYDKNSNIINTQVGNRLRNYLYKANSDRLAGVDDESGFTYNADGAVTASKSAGIDAIGYSNGRPVAFQTNAGDFNVTYDVAGNRLTKTDANGQKTIYLYNGGGKLSEEIKLADGDVKQYLYGQFGMRAIIDKDGTKDVYTDHLGSPRVIGYKGKTIAATHYTPFGKRMPITGEIAFGFNGYGIDEETGLYYSSYRLYDPEIGRFYSLDPKPGSESPYVFCGNDPINKIDPEGDSWWGVLLGAIVGIVGLVATVATAGAFLPATLASESLLVAETVVGAVAGAVSSVAGSLVTAACDKEPITAKMVLGSLISGSIGGLGSVAGPLGQFTMRSMMKAGYEVGKITATGIVTGCTIGLATGVGGSLAYSAITDTPVSGVSIAMAGLSGMGTGLLATRAVYGLMKPGGTRMLPVMIEQNEVNVIYDGKRAMNRNVNTNAGKMNVRQAFNNFFQNDKFFSFMDDATFEDVGRSIINDNIARGAAGLNPFRVINANGVQVANEQRAAVIACHGFGRHCFVISDNNRVAVWRPIKGSTFVDYFSQTYQNDVNQASYIKLFICFSGSSPGSSSTAKKFATALNTPSYGTKGIAYPTNADQRYLQF